MYKRRFANADWSVLIDAFPDCVPTTDLRKYASEDQFFKVGIKKTEKRQSGPFVKASFQLVIFKPVPRAHTERLI